MNAWVSRAALTAALAAALALPVVGQEAPKSILPEGFDEPASRPVAPPSPETAAPTPAPAPAGPAATPSPAPPAPNGQPAAPLPPGAAPALPVQPNPLDLPPSRARNLDLVGWPNAGGYGARTFAGSNGAFVTSLMRRLDTPIASRWAHIVLRRALVSVVPTPARVRPADWVAERAWLLLRMGEVDGAKQLVDAVPFDRYTPRLYTVAAQAHLAAADIPALCPLGTTAVTFSREPLWQLVNAMCAGLEGDDITAASIFDRLRDGESANPFDILLAERISTTASGGGRAANVEWDEVDRLTTYRFGLASAAGIGLPERLIDGTRPPVRAWQVRAPATSLEARIAAARTAAALGVVSAAELVDLFSLQATTIDPFALESTPAGRLRIAYVGRDPADRLSALRTIWQTGQTEAERYAARLITAYAAARFPIDEDYVDAAPELIASMLTAGLDRAALRWWPLIAKADGDARDAAWAMLVLADSGGRIPATPEAFEAWYKKARDKDGARATHRAQLLIAGLQGLGKTAGDGDWEDIAEDLGVEPVDNGYVRRLDAAAAGRRLGEVAVLAAIGLQSNWASVPPAHFQHIVAAYRRVGRAAEARMMVAEALMRG